MILKRCLNVALAASLVAPAAITSKAFAETSPNYQIVDNDDPIQLIVQAMTAATPEQRSTLLAKAKKRVAAEKLSAKTEAAIESLLSQAEAQPLKPLSGHVGTTFSIGNSNNSAAAVVPAKDSITQLQNLLESNPALRETLLEIGRGRLTRDANNLSSALEEIAGKTIQEQNNDEAAALKALTDSASFIQALKALPLVGRYLTDYAADNNALRERFRTIPVDELAQKVIKESVAMSMGTSAIRLAFDRLFASGGGAPLKMLGVGSETLITFFINANMILRLTDLYGVTLNSAQEEIVLTVVLAVSKIAIRNAANRPLAQQTAFRIGTLMAEAVHTNKPAVMKRFVLKVLSSPLLAGVTRNLPFVQKYGLAGAPAAAGAPEAGAAVPAAVRKGGLLVSALQIVGAGIETLAVGEISVWFLKGQRDRERAYDNRDFQEFLMGPDGEGFEKLLILSLNTGDKAPKVININHAKDSKAKFIVNLVRSMKVCSPADLGRYKVLNKQVSSAPSLSLKSMNDLDFKILKFACDASLSSARYDRMVREFMTFDAIPQDLIDTLRLASYQNRLRMGEILLQLQWLDGDQDMTELKFFRSTVGKILGFDRLEDHRYFDRMTAFIREQGGIINNPGSPTGYSIGNHVQASPYDLSIGYTRGGGPDTPRTAADPAKPSAPAPATPANPTFTIQVAK